MPSKFALIIANTEYTDPGLAQLTAPGKDAEDFARVLKDQDICAFDDVNVLLNQPEHIVRGAIDEFFDEKKSNDLLVLYFSGHGMRDEQGSLYLAVQNTIRKRLKSTAIKSDYIRDLIDQSRSRRQILILDCCNSGAFTQGTKAEAGGSIGTARAFEGTGFGRIVLTASDATQFAWEGDKIIDEETRNSLFTHFLVKGLEGEADLDGDRKITVDELYDYVHDQIAQRTPKQTPIKWSYKQQGEIVLRDNLNPQNTPPDYLLKLATNLDQQVRENAVRKLIGLLEHENPDFARFPQEKLIEVAIMDRNPQLRLMAARALRAHGIEWGEEPSRWQKITQWISTLSNIQKAFVIGISGIALIALLAAPRPLIFRIWSPIELTPTASPTPMMSATSTPTLTFTPSPSHTNTLTPTLTRTRTATPTPTLTLTPTPTRTLIPPATTRKRPPPTPPPP